MADPLLTAKAIALAVKNKDKIGKVVLGTVIGIVIAFVIFIMAIMGLIEAFLPDGIIFSSGDHKVEESAIYKAISGVNEKFYEKVKKEMEEKKQKLIESKTESETVVDAEGNETVNQRVNITIKTTFNYIGSGYLIAYLTYADELDFENIKINEDLAMEFLKKIYKIRVKKISEEEYEIENVYISDTKMARKFFKEDEIIQKKFIASCKAYADFFDTQEAEVNTDTININDGGGYGGGAVSLLEIPLYLQYAGGWERIAFGGGTIASSGCSVTSLAMVLSYLKQQVILPNHVVDFTGNRFYVPPAGQGWGIFPAVAEHWGVSCENIGKSEAALIQALREGKPVISSMSPGTFTRGGHFIVLSGITETGKIKVNDPNDSASKDFINKEFDVSLIMRESKNFWSFQN